MHRQFFTGVAAITMIALGACHQSGSNAGKDASNPGDSAPVNTVQDVAAGPVGVVSAATVGANTTEGFVTGAAMGDMYEIEAGKIAAQRGQSPAVKAFGQMMVDHHTKMSNEMKAALKTANAGVAPPAALDERRKGMLDNLRAAGDADFDLAYMHQQLAAHLEALTLHSGYADNGDNPTLKAVATKAKPIVEKHIAELKRIGGAALDKAT